MPDKPLSIGIGPWFSSALCGAAIPFWVLAAGGVPATVDIDFTTSQVFGGTLTNLCQCSRASSGMAQNADGSWVSFANNVPRITTNGLLVEEARTNSIRNNTMVGAIVMADSVELLTNGNFAAQGSGWTANGSVVFNTGSVQITGDGSTNNYIARQITGLTVGRNYVISALGPWNAVAFVGNAPKDGSVVNGVTLGGIGSAAQTSGWLGFTATSTSHWVTFARQVASTATWTQFSVQDGERVANGNFAFNPINASQNTVQNGWQWSVAGGTSSATWNGVDTVTLTGDGTNTVAIDASFPTAAGFTYTLSTDVGINAIAINVGTSRGSGTLLAVSVASPGAGAKYQFTATGTTTWVRFSKTAAASATIKNVSVQSAGALPTGWSTSVGNAGVLLNVVNVDTESGLNRIGIRYFGTTTGAFTSVSMVKFEVSANVAASYGQTWAASIFNYISAGSNANISSNIFLVAWRNSGGTSQGTSQGNAIASGGPLGSNRTAFTFTPTVSTVAGVDMDHRFTINSGVAIDVTYQYGMPQLENCNINSTLGSATINAGGSGGVDGTAVYRVNGGTGSSGASVNVTVSGGVITAINSVAGAGSYSVFPPSPATLSYISGTASGVTGASVNLTPTNNGALGFPTSPIATSGAAAARSSETITINGITLAQVGAILLRWAGSPTNTVNAKNRQYGWSWSDTGTNRLSMRAAEPSPSLTPNCVFGNGIVNSNVYDLIGLAAETNTGFMAAWNTSNSRISQNGRAVVSSATVWSPVAGTLTLGSSLNDYIKRFAYWSRDVSDAGMQQVSVTQ
ncbi:MAG TPA: hypothetical protein VIY48_20380 [Candidatus Paceibacterota bacterium]